jgi:hypothetical protein
MISGGHLYQQRWLGPLEEEVTIGVRHVSVQFDQIDHIFHNTSSSIEHVAQ